MLKINGSKIILYCYEQLRGNFLNQIPAVEANTFVTKETHLWFQRKVLAVRNDFPLKVILRNLYSNNTKTRAKLQMLTITILFN